VTPLNVKDVPPGISDILLYVNELMSEKKEKASKRVKFLA
jgi:hypothetical protein